MLRKNLFIFDIETVPDLRAAANLLDKPLDTDPEILLQELEEYHLKITDGRNAFFRQPFHQVVAISFLEAEIQYIDNKEFYQLKTIRSGGNSDSGEEAIIKGFFNHLAKINPRLVSFNGKTFDLPVLKYRAMLHGIQAEWLHQSGDKWNNYNSKYSLDWHCDLIDALSDFGSSARVKMNEVCAMLRLPGKLETEGSMVASMYNEGKIEEIRDYCELDVINTYLLYLTYAYHIAKISKDSYNYMLEDLTSFLENSDKNNFNLFLTKWKQLGIRYF